MNEDKNLNNNSNVGSNLNLRNNSYNKNDSAIEKLKNIRNNNRNVPVNHNQQDENSTSDGENVEEKQDRLNILKPGSLKEKVVSSVIGSTETAKKTVNVYKTVKIIRTLKFVPIIVALFIPLISVLFVFASSDSDIGRDTYKYVTTESVEDKELFEIFENYGYCKDEKSCKQAGAYEFFKKIKQLKKDYAKSCGDNPSINNPCGIRLNTALLVETVNYYQNALEQFSDSIYDEEVEAPKEGLAKFLSNYKKEKEKKAKLDKLVGEVEDLAKAQAEYVEEKCDSKTRHFYQISFDKYISYLKYGKTSTHPNYSGQPKKNDTCQGPKNDYISINKNTGEITSVPETVELKKDADTGKYHLDCTGINCDIVNDALKYVGGRYVWGGKNLGPDGGVDCSGFTAAIMSHFGINIVSWTGAQQDLDTQIGRDISKALPGDLITYYPIENGATAHVAIYMGNNQVVHAANEDLGIIVSDHADTIRDGIYSIVRLWDK